MALVGFKYVTKSTFALLGGLDSQLSFFLNKKNYLGGVHVLLS